MSTLPAAPILIEDQWTQLRQLLPEDLDQSARQHGAMRRQRGSIRSAEQLLRVLLMHVAGGLSLEHTVARAAARGLAKLNAMALHKRLCSSEHWLQALTSHVLGEITARLPQEPALWAGPYRVRLLDATDIQEPGSTGSDWRLHYSLRLPQLCCDFFELTAAGGGESLRRLPVAPGDLVLADRAYNDRRAVAQVQDQGGEVILRYHSRAFPLLDGRGRPWDPLPRLQALSAGQIGHWEVFFERGAGVRVPVRVCAVRKSPAAAARARQKSLYKARGQKTIAARTLEMADFVVVLTTLPRAAMPARRVLEFYRARWQVELAFKRLKSLLQMGQVPKKKAASARAWMQGKVLTALLIERLRCEALFFSPWGYPV